MLFISLILASFILGSCTAGTGENDGTTLTAAEKLCPVAVRVGSSSCIATENCSSEGQTACVTGSNYKAAAVTGLAAKILTGNTVAGVVGTAPAAPSDCTSDAEIGCRSTAGFPAGDASAISTWDLRTGTTIAGVIGSQKFCKNAARAAGEVTAAPGSAALDYYDTIDDYGGGAFPSLNVFSGIAGQVCNSSEWEDLTADGACDAGTDECVYRDRMTQLSWAEPVGGSTYTWVSAMTYCDGLTFAGYTDWRSPTQKEAMQSYVNGIFSLHSSSYFALGSANYWSATTSSLNSLQAFYFTYSQGQVVTQNKSQTYKVACVRP
jgi:hypothetical protein